MGKVTGKVVIHTNDRGNVTVYYPAPGVSPEHVLNKDVTPHLSSGHIAHIVDDESLPYVHDDFYDAWRLTIDEHGKPVVAVHHEAAKAVAHNQINQIAREAHRKRQEDAAIGLPTQHTDEQFKDLINNARSKVEISTTLDHLRDAITSVPNYNK